MSRTRSECWYQPVQLSLVLILCAGVFEPARTSEQPEEGQPRRLRIVVFGGHPDDPESGAGGLITLLTQAGHEVICGYATCFRGDRKFFDRPEAEVRREEVIEIE